MTTKTALVKGDFFRHREHGDWIYACVVNVTETGELVRDEWDEEDIAKGTRIHECAWRNGELFIYRQYPKPNGPSAHRFATDDVRQEYETSVFPPPPPPQTMFKMIRKV